MSTKWAMMERVLLAARTRKQEESLVGGDVPSLAAEGTARAMAVMFVAMPAGRRGRDTRTTA